MVSYQTGHLISFTTIRTTIEQERREQIQKVLTDVVAGVAVVSGASNSWAHEFTPTSSCNDEAVDAEACSV
jgi:hypothetical protein